MEQLNVPDGHEHHRAHRRHRPQRVEELQWDMSYLMQALDRHRRSVQDGHEAPVLIYQESTLVIRAIRDLLQRSTSAKSSSIPTRSSQQATAVHERGDAGDMCSKREALPRRHPALQRVSRSNTRSKRRTQPHGATCPRAARSSSTTLKPWSAVDVNSARSTRGSDIEETAVPHEPGSRRRESLARLRLRDLGGLIVDRFHRHGRVSKNQPLGRNNVCAMRCMSRPRPRPDGQAFQQASA